MFDPSTIGTPTAGASNLKMSLEADAKAAAAFLRARYMVLGFIVGVAVGLGAAYLL